MADAPPARKRTTILRKPAPAAAGADAPPARKRETVLRKTAKAAAEAEPPLASQKIRKERPTRSVLKGLYSALQVVAARRQGKAPTLGLNEAIDAFLAHLDTRASEVLMTQIGSRGLQLCLKHGMPRHRQHILLSLLKQNVLGLINSKYGVFLFGRLFKFCAHEPQFKLLAEFMQKNMAQIVQLKEGLLVLGAYADSLSQAAQLAFHFETVPQLALPDFFFEEFVAEKIYQRRYLTCALTHSLLLHHFPRVKAKVDDVLENVAGFFHLSARKGGTLVPLVGLLCRLYAAASWAARKALLKAVFRERFLGYFRREPCLILLLFALLARTEKVAALDLTLVAQLTQNFAEVAADPLSIKLFVYLLADKRFFLQDGTFAAGQPLHSLIELGQLMQAPNFEKNRAHVAEAVLTLDRLRPCLAYESVAAKSLQNSTFSIFYGLAVNWLAARSNCAAVVEGVFGEFFEQAIKQTQGLSVEGEGERAFFFSPIGHRLYKKLVQSLQFATEENKSVMERNVRGFVESIQPHLPHLINTKAVFVLIAIIEHSEMAEKLKFELNKIDLSVQQGQFSGMRILVGLLKK